MENKYEVRLLNRVVMASGTNWKKMWGRFRDLRNRNARARLYKIAPDGTVYRMTRGNSKSVEWEVDV